MITRRKLLVGLSWGVLTAPVTGNLEAAAARSGTGRRDNCAFVADLQASLRRAITAGEQRSDAEWRAVCPLCGDHLTISADLVA